MKFWENKKILLLAACVLTGIGGYWYYSDLPIEGKAVKVELLSNCIFMNAKMVEEYWSVKERDPKAPKITAVCYHEVGAPPNDIYSVSDKVFRTHLQEYKKAGYNFINAEDLASAVEGKIKLPPNPLLITFDDGYTNNYTHAMPILEAEGAKATVFMVSSKIGVKNRLTVNQLREMHAKGFVTGSHTVNHENLVPMSQEELDMEVGESRKQLEAKLGFPVRSIAYPCGKADARVLEAVAKHYKVGFFANMKPSRKETAFTYNRFGVYKWNEHINSIFKQKQFE